MLTALRYLITALVVTLTALQTLAQDCNSPGQLCLGDVQTLTLETFQPVDVECFDHPYTAYFTFTTNTNQDETGNVTVTVSEVNCGDDNDPAEVFAIVVAIEPGGDPCIPVSYLPASGCAGGDFFFTVSTESLTPSTTYLVIVGSDNDPDDFDCGFNVEVSGPAVSLNVCCTQQIVLGQQADLEVTGGNAVPGYSWSPAVTLDTATGPQVMSTPFETTEYTVTANVGPCNDIEAQVTVVVGPPITVPNTITPNGDGINDNWRIPGIGQFPNAQITVFDRWGQVVYKDIGYARPWDGTNNGRRLPTATYYYVIELNSDVIEIAPISGSITLVH